MTIWFVIAALFVPMFIFKTIGTNYGLDVMQEAIAIGISIISFIVIVCTGIIVNEIKNFKRKNGLNKAD